MLNAVLKKKYLIHEKIETTKYHILKINMGYTRITLYTTVFEYVSGKICIF